MDTHEAQLRDCLLLHSIPELSPQSLRKLLSHFGSAAALLAADPAGWRRLGLSSPIAAALARARDAACLPGAGDALAKLCEQLLTLGVGVLEYPQDDYPPLLASIHDPPPLLYVRGRPESLLQPQLAIVGSRKPSPAGLRIAGDMAARLSDQGLVISSGLALGIDGAAHRGALEAGGVTVAVMATGIEQVYPRRHRALAEELLPRGCLVTEFPPGTAPLRGHFPRRNRLVSGLSLGTLVVEAALPSGSLLTAQAAAEQGRDVFAVPWSILHPGGAGCLQLLRDGALQVQCADDITEGLAWFGRRRPGRATPEDPAAPRQLPGDAGKVLALVGYEAVAVEELAAAAKLPASVVQGAISLLELEGLVQRSTAGVIRS